MRVEVEDGVPLHGDPFGPCRRQDVLQDVVVVLLNVDGQAAMAGADYTNRHTYL